MEMHQVRYFLTLCQELNFTRAAEKCHAAQPTRTRAIKLLEGEFWREVNLATVRGRPHFSAIGALVREAMRTQWLGEPALAVQKNRAQNASKMH